MIAKSLEYRMAEVAGRSEPEMVQRFQELRNFGLLPKSRGRNAEDLCRAEVVTGILSIVSDKPGFAGLTTKCLRNLRPIGGVNASFAEAETFGEALEAIFESADALDLLLEVRVSFSEIYINGNGRGAIFYRDGEHEKVAYYVGKEAISLMQAGAEKSHDPRELYSSVIEETVFFPHLFKQIAHRIKEDETYSRLMN